MGCWSESCSISGMEIRHGDECLVAYASFTYEDSFYFPFRLNTPFFFGEYDDYGGVDLLEDYEPYGFKKGDNICQFDDRQIDEETYDSKAVFHVRSKTAGWVHDKDRGHWMLKGHRIFIHKKVFDILGGLRPEFVYNSPDTIKGQIEHFIEERIQIAKDSQTKYLDKAKELSEPDESDDDIKTMEMFGYLAFNGLRMGHDSEPWNGYSRELQDVFVENFPNIDADWASIFSNEHFVRTKIVLYASMELRKVLSPYVHGPQHGGAQALIPFYEGVLAIAKARQKEDDYENGDDE
ncbi:hypothetical protein phiOC_p388 [Ochrobactrum phage vB_OspM_OC]|nr:hypothetical protein phiOC_p388 [Ochrobactrum phage vB_OspM_OC]